MRNGFGAAARLARALALAACLARTLDQLTYQMGSILWSTQKHPDKVQRYFHAPQARYALV